MIFTKKEIKHLIISILLVTLAFAFDDKQPTFILSHWVFNYIRIALIVTSSFLVYQLTQKLVAHYHCTKTEYHLWNIKRYWFHPSCVLPLKGRHLPMHGNWAQKSMYNIKSIFIGPILLFLVSFFSMGRLFFVAVGYTNLIEKLPLRAEKRWMRLQGYEKAQIAIAGPFATLLLALILKSINPNLTTAIFINQMFSVFNMIPFSKLDGARVLFGSIPFYFFSLVLIILTILLMNFLSSLQSLIIALIFALIILVYIMIKLWSQ